MALLCWVTGYPHKGQDLRFSSRILHCSNMINLIHFNCFNVVADLCILCLNSTVCVSVLMSVIEDDFIMIHEACKIEYCVCG